MNKFLCFGGRGCDARVWRKLPVAALLMAAAASVTALPAVSRAEVAGSVAAVRVWAYGTPPEQPARRDLFLRDEVQVRELLETVKNGALHVRLMDDTMLRLGSASRVVVDEFVYDPNANTSTLLARVTLGVCRFVSGKAASRRLEVVTPAATIAARGTVFSVWIAEDGSTTIWVSEGQVEVTPVDGAAPALVDAGEIVLAPIAGGGIRLDAPRPSPDPGVGDTTRVLIPRRKSLR
jgi:hypothetical protein